MSATAIMQTSQALQHLIQDAIGSLGRAAIASPARVQDGQIDALVSLYLYHILPNPDLRNEDRVVPPDGPGGDGGEPIGTYPVDLRYLITVHPPRNVGQGDPLDQLALGRTLQALHVQPTIPGSLLPGQTVRITPDPISMEEISRVWGLFPNTPYQTSVIYLASPVFIDARQAVEVPFVESLQVRMAKRAFVQSGGG